MHGGLLQKPKKGKSRYRVYTPYCAQVCGAIGCIHPIAPQICGAIGCIHPIASFCYGSRFWSAGCGGPWDQAPQCVYAHARRLSEFISPPPRRLEADRPLALRLQITHRPTPLSLWQWPAGAPSSLSNSCGRSARYCGPSVRNCGPKLILFIFLDPT